MLVQSLSVIRSNILVFVVVALSAAALLVIGDILGTEFSYAAAIVWGVLGFLVQKAVILDSGRMIGAAKPTEGLLTFLWKFLVLLAVFPLPPAMIAVMIILVAIGNSAHSIVLSIIFFFLFQAWLVSLLGTWPISGAVKADTSIKAALHRAKKGRFPRFLRLLLAVALTMIVQLPFALAAIRIGENTDLKDPSDLSLVVSLYFVVNIATALGTAYTSVVMVNAFADDDMTKIPRTGSEIRSNI